jgi:hypothetical protein
LLVTIPPLQMSKSVAAHVSHAKQLSQGIDLAEFPEFILKKITADYGILAYGKLWGTHASRVLAIAPSQSRTFPKSAKCV